MIRRQHFYYDLRELLVSGKILALILLIGGGAILYISFDFVLPVALLVAGLFAVRGLIGRRCPLCDGPLKEDSAVRDEENAFIMHITWRCPRDGHEEQETTKGDAGLFGVN